MNARAYQQQSDQWSRRDWVTLAVALIGAGIILFVALSLAKQERGLPPPLKVFDREFSNFEPMPNSRPAEQTIRNWRQSSALVSQKYLTPASQQAVLSHYRAQMSQYGWIPDGGFDARQRWGVDYCKGSLVASLEFSNQLESGMHQFWFAISWDGAKRCATEQ